MYRTSAGIERGLAGGGEGGGGAEEKNDISCRVKVCKSCEKVMRIELTGEKRDGGGGGGGCGGGEGRSVG